MSNEELDKIVAKIISEADIPMSLGRIERRVEERGIKADTFDVQRSVQRLVERGLAKLTPKFLIESA